MIANDPRPQHQRDRFQYMIGTKRTNIESVRVVRVPETGTAPPTIKSLAQTTIADAGNTVTAPSLPTGPIAPSSVEQHILSDCWLLTGVLLMLLRDPSFFDDLIVDVGNGKVVVQLYAKGIIVQITTSLVVSTDYDKGDVRVELIEKAYSLFRNGISSYFQLNLGNLTDALGAFGLDVGTITPTVANIAAAVNAGKVVGLSTSPTAPSPWVQNHSYAFRTFDTIGSVILRNPWSGGVDMAAVPGSTILDRSVVVAAQTGTFPASKRLQKLFVNIAAEPLAPIAGVIPVTTTAIAAAGSTTVAVGSYSAISGEKLETVNGVLDLGYDDMGGCWVDYALSFAAAGTITIAAPVASPAAGKVAVLVNGTVAGNLSIANTTSFQNFTNASTTIQVPAGEVTLRLAATGYQYNLRDLTITPASAKHLVSVAIVGTYSDGTTETLSMS